jgi:hypothetical protein
VNHSNANETPNERSKKSGPFVWFVCPYKGANETPNERLGPTFQERSNRTQTGPQTNARLPSRPRRPTGRAMLPNTGGEGCCARARGDSEMAVECLGGLSREKWDNLRWSQGEITSRGGARSWSGLRRAPLELWRTPFFGS